MSKIKLQPEFNDIYEYLKESFYIDYKNENIQNLINSKFNTSNSQRKIIEKAYLFVRDEIAHSWDIKSNRVTITASEVLQFRQGICYAKANLLAAILRSLGVPTGFCYQRLTLADMPDAGYCIHALNAVYINKINKWIRLDARGNKEGIDAQFSVYQEKLAFPIRTNLGEVDYPTIYASPLKSTMETLENNTDSLYMYLHNLPTEI